MRNHFLYETYRLLSASQRKRGAWMVLQLALSSILDFFSLAFFLPLILFLVDPGTIQHDSLFQRLFEMTGLDSVTQAAVLFTGFIFAFIALKTIINIAISKRKAKYAYEVCSDFASRAVSRYLKLPYLQFTQAQISNEINNIANLPLIIANNIIIPAGTLFSETLVTILLLSAVAVYDIKVFAFLLIVMVPAFLVYKVRRQRIKEISKLMRNAYSSLFSITLKMVEGLLDIRAFGKEIFFKEKFEEASRSITGTFAKDHSSQASISRYTEVIAAWCICLMIIFTLLTYSGKMEILLLLGVYAGASFRVIPSMNRILSSIQQMKVHESNVNEFCGILSDQDRPKSTESIVFKENIKLKSISFAYPGHPTTFGNLNLTLRKGEKIAITGKSGVGKTSILLIMLRFLEEQHGEILVDNNRITERNLTAWRRLIGYVPQNPYILDGSIADNVAFGVHSDLIDQDRVQQLIQDIDLEKWVRGLPEGIHTRIGEKGAKISGGQRQRIAIARALYNGSLLLLLDEVTNQLDAITEEEVVNRLLTFNDPEQTIVMITHHPDLLKRFDKVYDLNDGQLKVKEQIAQSV